jgi:hypothetical protein
MSGWHARGGPAGPRDPWSNVDGVRGHEQAPYDELVQQNADHTLVLPPPLTAREARCRDHVTVLRWVHLLLHCWPTQLASPATHQATVRSSTKPMSRSAVSGASSAGRWTSMDRSSTWSPPGGIVPEAVVHLTRGVRRTRGTLRSPELS